MNGLVRCDWRATNEHDQMWRGMYTMHTDERGHFKGFGAISSDAMHESNQIDLVASIIAYGEFSETEPSMTHYLKLPATSDSEVDLQLGPKYPTVDVRVRDTKGDIVDRFWVHAMRAEGGPNADDMALPHRDGRFDDGVAELGAPPHPFRVRVHLYGGKREAIVGPFDPASLPALVDVTLPDE